MNRTPDPLESTPAQSKEAKIATLVQARRADLTLREAAKLAGVHVATVCRWQARDPALRKTLVEAEREAKRHRYLLASSPRPQVRWHTKCPACQAKVVVRAAGRWLRFWRCGRWPWCTWASWRPRALQDCRRCGAACFWSHSRKSVICSGCGMRISAH